MPIYSDCQNLGGGAQAYSSPSDKKLGGGQLPPLPTPAPAPLPYLVTVRGTNGQKPASLACIGNKLSNAHWKGSTDNMIIIYIEKGVENMAQIAKSATGRLHWKKVL